MRICYEYAIEANKSHRYCPYQKGIINVKFQHKHPETPGKPKRPTAHEHFNK